MSERRIDGPVVCVYHSADLDGHCSGAVMRHYFQDAPDVTMVGHDYGRPFPYDLLGPECTLVMADLCVEPFAEEMPKIADKVGRFIWIDHHKSAIEGHEAAGLELEGLRRIGSAACELTWEYLFGDDMPDAVRLLGRYDVWDHAADERVVPFQMGMWTLDTRPELRRPGHDPWARLLGAQGTHEADDAVRAIVADGEVVRRYVELQNRRVCETTAFETEFDGLRALACNTNGASSKLFESVYDERRHDIMVPFCWKIDAWSFSIFTTHDHIDCSEIAQRHGGGGHAKAAGFRSPNIPFIPTGGA